jgi:hypothetical protein
MTRDDLKERILDAIDRVHDMDVTHDDYAESVADELWAEWNDRAAPNVKPLDADNRRTF